MGFQDDNQAAVLKGELKAHIHISLYESNTHRIGCCPPFSLSEPMRGEF